MVYSHKNETIDVITSKNYEVKEHLVGLSHIYFNRGVVEDIVESEMSRWLPTPMFGKNEFPISSKASSHGLLTSSHGLLTFEDVWTHSPSDRNHVPGDTESTQNLNQKQDWLKPKQDAINNQRASTVHQLKLLNQQLEIQRELRVATNEQYMCAS